MFPVLEREVGASQERSRIFSVLELDDAEGQRQVCGGRDRPRLEKAVEPRSKIFGALTTRLWQEDCEPVALEAEGEGDWPHDVLHSLREPAEDAVALDVTLARVDVLEVVDIEQHKGEW